MLGVVAEVEFLLDLGRGQRRRYLRVGQQFLAEILAFFPDLHGVALHQP
jgi:hypothetical protein